MSTVTHEERVARVALNRLVEPGDPRLGGLVEQLGAVAVRDHLLGREPLEGLRDDVSERLRSLDPEGDLERAARQGIRFVVPGDAEWPDGLDDLGLAGEVHRRGGVPVGLWVRSRLPLTQLSPGLAVVGSRSSTSYGDTIAREIGATAAEAGFCIVSGAAVGIDQAAHRGALAGGGTTVAVLACGADRVYPAAHKGLVDHIAEVGAVVSEAAPGSAPTRIRFLSRNRIIAALSRGSVVVEAAIRSGALNTMNWTERLNRPLMAVPGPVTSAQSQGVHERLRSGAAVLVTRGADVLEVVGRPGEHLAVEVRAPVRARDHLSLREAQVLDAVPVVRTARAESIARSAGVGLVEARACLAALSRSGLVEGDEQGWRLAGAARA